MKIFGRKDRPAFVIAASARQMVNNLLVTASGDIWAGYRCGVDRWDFTGEQAKASAIDASAEVWAELAKDGGRAIHERVTARPFPVTAWARSLDLRTPNPLPDVPGALSYNGWLALMQHRVAEMGLDDKIVYRYLKVGSVRPRTDVRSALLAGGRLGDARLRDALEEEAKIFAAVSGWRAVRMSEAEQGWLRARSAAPGVPAALPEGEGGWDEFSIRALSGDVRWRESPLGRTVGIMATRGGLLVERAVQVLSVARFNDMAYPGNGLEPWQTFAERALDPRGVPFSVEWSLTGELHTGLDLEKASDYNLRVAMSLKRDYQMHREPPPEYTDRGIAAAKRIRDEVSTGQAVDSVRFVGTIDAIVTGEARYDDDGQVLKTAAEVCEERADALRRLYAAAPLRMEMAVAHPQHVKLAATIPGEPRERTGYQRQVRMDYLAAGYPSATTRVGDRRGPYLGHTRGSARRAVMHDPHYATEGQGAKGRGQNMWIEASTLGAGKSVLLGGGIIYPAVRRGTRVVVSDPSGPLGALCDMPELAPFSRRINLLNGEPGVLNPAALIREPGSDEFDSREDWDRARRQAATVRKMLTVDAARRAMPADLYENPRTQDVLSAAASRCGWSEHASLWNVIARLDEMDDLFATRVMNTLLEAVDHPLLGLLFPPPGKATIQPSTQHRLTVISTPGIRRAPDSAPRQDWNPEEIGADVLLRLVAFYSDRLIYGKPRDERAIAVFDEAEDLLDFGGGRGYVSRLGRDHSKWNIAVHLALKSIDPQMLTGEIRNFLAGAFVGRMANQGAAEAMLDILGITDKRYARTLMRLSERQPGEFVHLDVDGQVGAIKVDVDYHPALKAALNTNPEPVGADAWEMEEM